MFSPFWWPSRCLTHGEHPKPTKQLMSLLFVAKQFFPFAYLVSRFRLKFTSADKCFDFKFATDVEIYLEFK